ncbi:O-antigen ligase family protein [Roseobacter sp. HKCCA0882]|uniref:O-antigen ligase family protein n=1 Tax=Roseobacter sp. HKCCA0882 TaxID=3120337 RepID=UPI0030EED7C5
MLKIFNQFIANLGAGRKASLAEVLLIGLSLFCLPLFEAPKNVFSILFLIAWLFCAVRSRSVGGSSPFGLVIFGLMAVLWVSPIFSEFKDLITPLNSAPRWTLLALFVLLTARLDYSRDQLLFLWAAALLGGIVAVFESFWAWHLNGKPYPEFRSVGHVNHSSMYSLVLLAVGIGSLYVAVRWLNLLGLLAIVATVSFLPPSKSLVGGVAIAAILLIASVNLSIAMNWSRRTFLMSLLTAILAISAVLLLPPAEGFRSELVARVTGDNLFSGRDKILNSALAVWDQHPILGTGWFSFGAATSEANVRAVLDANGINYDGTFYWHFPHGHNLWTTILIERGLVGLFLITILLFLYFKTFMPIAFTHEKIDPLDRGVSSAAFLVAVGFTVAGLGNTTMMNEHGHAGMAFIAIAYGYLRGNGRLSQMKSPIL